MADLPVGNEGNLNGATAVTILAAPAASKQRIVPANGVSFYNADSVSHDFTVQKNKNSTITIVWKQASVASGAVVLMAKKVTLDATDESLEAKIEGAHTTTAPTFDVSAGETS
jgi:hypothetical protein